MRSDGSKVSPLPLETCPSPPASVTFHPSTHVPYRPPVLQYQSQNCPFQSFFHKGAVSLVLVRDSPPCPPGPLSCQGSIATSHTYGGAKGAGEFFLFSFSPILSTLHLNAILEPNLDSNAHPNPQPTPNPTPKTLPVTLTRIEFWD